MKLFQIDNKLFVSANSSALLSYNMDSDSWSDVSGNIPQLFSGSASFVMSGKLYVIFGEDSETGEIKNEVWEYNPSTEHWQQKGDFPGLERIDGIGFTNNK